MSKRSMPIKPPKMRLNVFTISTVLIFLAVACSLPSLGQRTAVVAEVTTTPTLPPTPTPQPLPPDLVESDPPQGVEVPLEGPITLFFNQPMERASVEAAMTSQLQQQLTFNWVDNSTLVIYLSAPLEPETELAFNISAQARSAQGIGLIQPISLNYRSAGYLRLAQNLPEPESVDVDPSSAIVAGFNRPIVALGVEQASLPAAFNLTPAAEGRGEWLNTSTYIFYPDPPLEGGKEYSVLLNRDLKSVDGGPLEDVRSWNFSTANPRLVSIEPVTEIPWPLDADIVLTFNQPMDPTSVEANFSLTDQDDNPVSGATAWDEDNTIFTFTPDSLLMRAAGYNLKLAGNTQARGGTTLQEGLKASVVTVPRLSVLSSMPEQGGRLEQYNNPQIIFSAPLLEEDLLEHIQMNPTLPNLDYWWDQETQTLNLFGAFTPKTDYTLTILPTLLDQWGEALGQEFQLNFRTAPLQPNLTLITSGEAIFVTPQDTSIQIQAVNLSSVPLTVGSVPLDDFIDLLSSDGYEKRQVYQSADQASWEQTLELEPDLTQTVELFLSPDRTALEPGIYYLRFNFPGDSIYPGPYFVIVSNLNITMKTSATDSLLWVMDLRQNTPVSNAPVTLYTEKGDILTSGQTDSAGVFQASFSPLENPYSMIYALVGQPGQEDFGMALSSWSQGLEPWDFGYQGVLQPPGLKIYFYTDRPIYRPGQKVYFRAIARQAYNGRYTMADIPSLPVSLTGPMGMEIATFDLPLSGFGTAHGEYQLPGNAQPGYYSMNSAAASDSWLNFQVAEYRKPEINLQVRFSADQAQAGQNLAAAIDARYFFDAPANNLPVHWALYAAQTSFNLPGYVVGLEDTSWLDAFRQPDFADPLGALIIEGDELTDSDGILELSLPTESSDQRLRYTLEATIQDESGTPVSARDAIEVNPDEIFIGLRPDAWVGRAGEPSGFEVQIVDWDGMPAGSRNLSAEFKKVVWERQDPVTGDPFQVPTYTPRYTDISNTDFETNQEGEARLAFTPPEPGTYQVDVFNPNTDGARTNLSLWVGGAGQAIWPNLPNSRLRLISDKSTYLPGDNAQVFIPNVFGREAPALVTIERGTLIRNQTLAIPTEGATLNLPLSGEDAPNVYVSVTQIGSNDQGYPDLRQGYLNLPVEPVDLTLDVSLLSQPERAGPGDEVTFDVQVRDSTGNPVQGEFSLAVVDLAALALADPNSLDIVAAFYSEQPNGVRTSHSLAAYPRRLLAVPGGMGGGGDEFMIVARESFPDTAYWNAEIVTDAEGKAQVSLALPDTLTTWQVETRGATTDTRVGQANAEIVTTKELLVRPVTPRFLVVDDHVQLAAVIQNNSLEEIPVEISLKVNGILLDDPSLERQQAGVPAQGRARVEWWGKVQDVNSVDLVFSVEGNGATTGTLYQDASRPAPGALPVMRYLARQSFRTAGTLDTAGEIQELVSLPRSYETQSGYLDVRLSPSLAATIIESLEVLETYPYESTEQIASSFLANLETFRTLQLFEIDATGLQTNLDRNLNNGLQRLLARQNEDGGWGWWQNGESDPYISAYVLLGLSHAQEAGISVGLDQVQRVVDYLSTNGTSGQSPSVSETWFLDRMVYEQFVLSGLNRADLEIATSLYQTRELLSPWAQALLALTLENLSPGNQKTRTLISDLESTAVRLATGAYWEMAQDESGRKAAQQNMHTTLSNSAVVLFALAQRDPGSPLVRDSVQYLMANRSAEGAWYSTYTTAWTLVAFNEVIKGTGELGGDYNYSAMVNGNLIAQGQASGEEQITPVAAQVEAQSLYPDYPNVLVIQREPGQGRLHYTAGLNVSRPVDQVTPLSQGLNIERAYFSKEETCPPGECEPVKGARMGERVTARLTLTLPQDVYYLAVEDYIPAGSEILDISLKTSQQGEGEEPQEVSLYDPRRPYEKGWGWWLFNESQIYDDHIAWTADYLPAGTYELTYTLVILQPGEYQVLPARAWQLYFPEAQANSSGTVFEIKP